MNSLFTRPVGALVLHEKGEAKERLGPNTRAVPYATYKQLENLIIKNSLLPISADITPIHPPFFTEFTYTDIFGGFLVTTLSSEINYRVVEELGGAPQDHVKSLFTQVSDKYRQSALPESLEIPKKIIFMTGTNLFLRVVNTSLLDELMATDDWYVKPHPLTNDHHLKEYGAKYGYDRIIEKSISGYALYTRAEQVASVNSSELTVRAILDGKPLTDVTAFSERYMHAYSGFIESARKCPSPKHAMLDKLSDKESGFLFPQLSDKENIERLHAYQRKAVSMREPFRMRTHQQLMVRRKTDPTSPQSPSPRKSP